VGNAFFHQAQQNGKYTQSILLQFVSQSDEMGDDIPNLTGGLVNFLYKTL